MNSFWKFLFLLTLCCMVSTVIWAQNTSVKAVKVDKAPLDPSNAIWKKAPPYKVDLMVQNVTTPMLDKLSVSTMTVRSVHDGTTIAFLLEWTDATRDATVDVDKFTDQVAIQLPVDPQNPGGFMMGNKGGKVHIIHWKALWQDDIDKGYRDVGMLHPNYWVDMYMFSEKTTFAEGEFPSQTTARDFRSHYAKNYMPGVYSNNPMSELRRTTPVEELIAEGFGTATTQTNQNAAGKGVWEKGKWRVVIARPLISEDPDDAALAAQTMIGFAVWNGSERNIGARKQYAPWVPLVIEKR